MIVVWEPKKKKKEVFASCFTLVLLVSYSE